MLLTFSASSYLLKAAMAIIDIQDDDPPGEGYQASLILRPWVSESLSCEDELDDDNS